MLENLNQINLMNKIKQNISNVIIVFFILLGIYSLFFGIFTIKTDYDWSIKIIFFSSSIIVFFIFIFFLSKKLKDTFVTILTTSYFAFLFVNFYLEISIPDRHADISILAKKENKFFDPRSKVEVINDLKKNNIDAHPAMLAGLLQSVVEDSTITNSNIYPLAGVSNVTTVMCNENGYYSIYKSDRFGFNNDDNYYEKDNKIMILGDSMIHGFCVNPGNDVAGYLRSKGYNALSFGIANNGPLTELGTIREYVNYVKPKIILWVFHPNDLYDIKREIKKPILKDYFKENFYQNLVNRQNEIDFFLKNIMDSSKNGIKSKSKAFFITLKRNIRSHLTLHNLRYFLNISSMSNNYELFEKIITLAKNESEKANAELYFIFLPDHRELQIAKSNNRINQILNKLDIEIINFTKILKETDDPLEFFPWRRMIHFNEKGYAFLGDIIIKEVLSDKKY